MKIKSYVRREAHLVAVALSLGTAFAAAAPDARAQSDDSAAEGIEEVIVSARKRNEDLQRVPISVAAFSADRLAELGVGSADELSLHTPGLFWESEFGKSSPQIYLRGIGTNNFGAMNTGPVALYKDNIFHGPNLTYSFSLYDLERVEVIKGPQGTLYGRNAVAGLVNFHSRKPDVGGPANGYFGAEVGEYATTHFEGAVGMPLSDKAAARVSFASNRNDGWWKNLNPAAGTDRGGKVDDVSGRLQLALAPGDQTDILFSAQLVRSDADMQKFKHFGAICPPGVSPNLNSGCPNLLGFTDTNDPWETFGGPEPEELESFGMALQANHDFGGGIELHFASAWDEIEFDRVEDLDDTPMTAPTNFYHDEFEYSSHELRLSSSDGAAKWHVGLFYYDESYEGLFALDASDVFDYNGTGPSSGNVQDRAIDTESYAAYADVDFQATEKLRLGAGVRWTYEEKSVTRYDSYFYPTLGTTSLGRPMRSLDAFDVEALVASFAPNSKDFDKITYRASADYQFTDRVMGYASYSTGIKGGEVRQAAFNVLASRVIDPETLKAIEIGAKTQWLGGRLVANASVYRYLYEGQQVSTLTALQTGFVTALVNAGETESRGVELETTYAPNDRWSFNGQIAWLDSEFTDFILPPGLVGGNSDWTGHKNAYSPEWSGTFSGRYSVPLSGESSLSVQGDLAYRDKLYFQSSNVEALTQDAYAVLNAFVEYEFGGGRYGLGLRGKNLTNEAYGVTGVDLLTFIGSFGYKYGQPRTVTAEFRARF